MTGWLIAGGVLLLLVLLGQIRLGVAAGCPEDGAFYLSLRIGPFRFKLLPARKKSEAPQKSKKPPKGKKKKKMRKGHEQKKPTAGRRADMLSLALRIVPPAAKAAGRMLRKIRIDRLEMHLIWAADDPASAATGYGKAQAAMGILWPPLEHNFRVKERDLTVDVDFDRAKPVLIAHMQMTLTLGQMLSFGLRLAAGILPVIAKKR